MQIGEQGIAHRDPGQRPIAVIDDLDAVIDNVAGLIEKTVACGVGADDVLVQIEVIDGRRGERTELFEAAGSAAEIGEEGDIRAGQQALELRRGNQDTVIIGAAAAVGINQQDCVLKRIEFRELAGIHDAAGIEVAANGRGRGGVYHQLFKRDLTR